MQTTRSTLLARVRDLKDEAAWREFDGVYRAVIRGYARRRGLAEVDALEIAQSCMATLVKQMPQFEYDPGKGRFRSWLAAIVENRVRDAFAKRRPVGARSYDLNRPDDNAASPSELWVNECQKEELRFCVEIIRQELTALHWSAFQRHALDQEPADKVANSLDLSKANVWTIKSRTLSRLRELMSEHFGYSTA